jgi:hypothetical protein
VTLTKTANVSVDLVSSAVAKTLAAYNGYIDVKQVPINERTNVIRGSGMSIVADILIWIGQSSIAALLLLVLGYFCRHLIEARLTRSVQHEFDKKLAKFNKELQEEVRRLEAVRSTGFAALLAQRNALAAKRIEAAQGLWNAVLDARKGTGVAFTLEVLNVPEVVKSLKDPKIRQYLNTVGAGEVMTPEYLTRLNSEHAAHQPFVSAKAWALYAVYAAIITFSISRLQILQSGFDPERFLKATHWMQVIDAALIPEDFKRIGTSSEYGLEWALKRLEERIVDELRLSMTGEFAGLEGAGDAQKILDVIDRFQFSTAKAQKEVSEARSEPQ